MYELILERSQRSVDAVRRHIDSSNAIRSLIAQRQIRCVNEISCFDLSPFYERTPNSTDWRIIDHCSAVTRLYSIYEQFVHELLGAFLTFLENNVSYSELEPVLRAEHRRSLGQILLNLDRERYRNLQFESIIGGLAKAFSQPGSYRLLPEAMLAHDQNLRLLELSKLFNRCGVFGVTEWIPKHRSLRKFFSDQARQSDKAEAELKQLVDYRNDAAHGEVDTVLGADILIEYADFLSAMFIALAECVQWSVVERSLEYKKTRLAGKVNEVFSKNIVVAIVENATFAVGDSVYLRGDGYCYRAKILSLQEGGVEITSKTVLSPIELGMRFDSAPRKTSEIYFMNAAIAIDLPAGAGSATSVSSGSEEHVEASK